MKEVGICLKSSDEPIYSTVTDNVAMKIVSMFRNRMAYPFLEFKYEKGFRIIDTVEISAVSVLDEEQETQVNGFGGGGERVE